MFETFDVTHRREPLHCELTHMAKIYNMLSQIAEGCTRNLAALLGCFVGTKSDGEVLEDDAATPGEYQVQYQDGHRASTPHPVADTPGRVAYSLPGRRGDSQRGSACDMSACNW